MTAESKSTEGAMAPASGEGRGAFPAIPAAGLSLCVLIGGIGFALGLGGENPGRAWSALLVNLLFWTGLASGAVLFLAVTTITAARWPKELRRLSASFATFLPLSVVLFVLLAFGLEHVFPWASGGPEAGSWWNETAFFIARNVVGLALLAGTALVLARGFLRNRIGPSWSVAYALMYAFVLSILSIDGVMSRTPHWISTLYPAYFFVGSFMVGLAALLFLAVILGRPGRAPDLVSPGRLGDLSNLTLGFGLFTAYTFYTQVLVIWYGNLPAETVFLLHRLAPPWDTLSAVVFVSCFALPLFLIPVGPVKRNPRVMGSIALVLLCGMWLERFLVVGPPPGGGFHLGWVELAVTAGFLGLQGLGVLFFLHRFPLRSSGEGKTPAGEGGAS
ncbi:MAG: hypothetical protein ACYTHN_01805 [Planctomycetota bacterium]|jgi:hypothetical protein